MPLLIKNNNKKYLKPLNPSISGISNNKLIPIAIPKPRKIAG
jgi:hypothetical protein